MAKYSRQREAILRAVRASYSHPTAYEIYDTVKKDIPNISLGTVYRNLSNLANDGEIDALLLGDGSIRYDGNLKGHLHLTCNKCGTVYDVELANAGDALRESAEKFGFETEHGVYVLYGICKNCQEQ